MGSLLRDSRSKMMSLEELIVSNQKRLSRHSKTGSWSSTTPRSIRAPHFPLIQRRDSALAWRLCGV
jgi:hypothetical protein